MSYALNTSPNPFRIVLVQNYLGNVRFYILLKESSGLLFLRPVNMRSHVQRPDILCKVYYFH